MSAGAVAGTKFCCKCSKDVTHMGRMKGTDGRYWCIDCGKADENVREASAGGTCHGCGEPFGKPELTRLNNHVYCPGCVKKQFGEKRSFVSKVWAHFTGRA